MKRIPAESWEVESTHYPLDYLVLGSSCCMLVSRASSPSYRHPPSNCARPDKLNNSILDCTHARRPQQSSFFLDFCLQLPDNPRVLSISPRSPSICVLLLLQLHFIVPSKDPDPPIARARQPDLARKHPRQSSQNRCRLHIRTPAIDINTAQDTGICCSSC